MGLLFVSLHKREVQKLHQACPEVPREGQLIVHVLAS
jgi:hypothetical protein